MDHSHGTDWIHLVQKVSGSLYQITNSRTGWFATFVYNDLSCTRGPGYKVECGWGGPADPLFEKILPVLDWVYRQFNPNTESFTWEVQAVESWYDGKEYTDMDHVAHYTCQVDLPQPHASEPLRMLMQLGFYNGWFSGATLLPFGKNLSQKRLRDMESLITATIREKLEV